MLTVGSMLSQTRGVQLLCRRRRGDGVNQATHTGFSEGATATQPPAQVTAVVAAVAAGVAAVVAAAAAAAAASLEQQFPVCD